MRKLRGLNKVCKQSLQSASILEIKLTELLITDSNFLLINAKDFEQIKYNDCKIEKYLVFF